MVQETRVGVPIGVLNVNVQQLQQQVEAHATSIETIGTRLERIEGSFANLQALLEERLPPRQPEPIQPLPQNVQVEKTPLRQPAVEEPLDQRPPIGAEARNAIPMRPH